MTVLFLFIFSLWAEPEVLPTIKVSGDSISEESTRATGWPTQIQKTKPTIRLPQIEDAFNSFNGVQSRTQGSPTFSVRGSAQSGRALVLFDHIPLNFASGFGAPRIFLPKESISDLVVVKGPGSLFYGSQAMAGAIDFISKIYKEPEFVVNFSDTNESFLPWRQGSLAHQSYQLAAPLYQKGSSFLQASAFYEDDDGQFPFQNNNGSGVRGNNSSNLSRLSFKGAQLGESWRLDYNLLGGKQIQQSPGAITFPLVTRQDSQGFVASVSPHYFFNDSQSIKTRLTHMKLDSDFLESGMTSFSNQTTTSFQNEWIYDFSDRSKLQFFADGFFHELDNSFVGQNLKQDNFEAGPFLSFFSTNKLKHQVGGRYLFRNKKFLPSLSTHFYFNNVDSWLSYSQGFRNPTLTDLFSNSPFFIGNPDLEAETSEQVELGMKSKEPRKLTWDFRLFHMEYKNFVESFERTPGVFSRTNRGSGYSRGFDWEVKWTNPMFIGSLVYNYLNTKSRQLNRSFRLSPRHQVTLNLWHNFGIFDLQIQNTHWYKVIDVSLNQAVDLEDWQQWNFFLSKNIFGKTQIQIGLVNAFNEGKQLTLNYPEPQRKYWLQLRQRF